MTDPEYKTIHDALRAWGNHKARDNRAGGVKYSSASITGPDWDRRKKTCQFCYGRGWVAALAPDEVERCGYCLGDGWIWERVPLVDPATIPGRFRRGRQGTGGQEVIWAFFKKIFCRHKNWHYGVHTTITGSDVVRRCDRCGREWAI